MGAWEQGRTFLGDLVPVVASLEGPGLHCSNRWPQHLQLKRRPSLCAAMPRAGDRLFSLQSPWADVALPPYRLF